MEPVCAVAGPGRFRPSSSGGRAAARLRARGRRRAPRQASSSRRRGEALPRRGARVRRTRRHAIRTASTATTSRRRTNSRRRSAPARRPIVFTGAMDYWPNVDAVSWFAREVLPADRGGATARALLHRRHESRRRRSGRWRSDPGVVVTGASPTCGRICKHARVVVAPLRVARGIQNKVLEAMAMARPVVVRRPPPARCRRARASSSRSRPTRRSSCARRSR